MRNSTRLLVLLPLVVLSLLGSGVVAHAVLIAYEPFAGYTVGLRLSGNNGGFGWAGAWSTGGGGAISNVLIVASNLTNTKFLLAAGNSARTSNSATDIRDFRQIDASIGSPGEPFALSNKFGRDGTTIWIAFVARLAAGSNTGVGGLRLFDGVNLAVTDGDKANHERMLMGDRATTGTNWSLSRSASTCGSTVVFDSTVPVDATKHLLVYRYDFTNSAVDVRLYIDPMPGLPLTNAPAITATNLCAFFFDFIALGSVNESLDVDELRIATTFAEAAPIVPALLSISKTNGLERLHLSAVVQQEYGFDASTAFNSWTNLGSAVTDTNGVALFDDTNSVQYPFRFYRAVMH